jgi:hypothetical protein
MYSYFFNCSTVRKFHYQLEFSDLLKIWHPIISGQAYSPLTQKFDYCDLLLEVSHFCMRFSVLYVVVVVVHYCHLPSIILCVSCNHDVFGFPFSFIYT